MRNVRARLEAIVARLPDRGWVHPLQNENLIDNDGLQNLQNNDNAPLPNPADDVQVQHGDAFDDGEGNLIVMVNPNAHNDAVGEDRYAEPLRVFEFPGPVVNVRNRAEIVVDDVVVDQPNNIVPNVPVIIQQPDPIPLARAEIAVEPNVPAIAQPLLLTPRRNTSRRAAPREEPNRPAPPANVCTICLDRNIGKVMIPCGHCFCQFCADVISHCGLCRRYIDRKIPIFL